LKGSKINCDRLPRCSVYASSSVQEVWTHRHGSCCEADRGFSQLDGCRALGLKFRRVRFRNRQKERKKERM